MTAPATAEPDRGPLEQARVAAAALSRAWLELSDRISAAEARALGARDRRATRAVAEALVDRLVGRLAAQAGNFGAGLLVATGARAEGEVWRTLVNTSGIAFWAALDPDRVKAWLLDVLDREAGMVGGWSTVTEAEADERQRRAEDELRSLLAQERKLLREAGAMGLTLPTFGDADPGVTTAREDWRAGHKVEEHGR